jgi:outer membrane protein OmpA-like peptidoglycan-associated protein
MKKSTMMVALAATLLSVSVGQASEFAGGWVGANAGVNRSDVTNAGAALGSGNAATYGFEAGYNWDVKNILLGVDGFADYNQKVNHTSAAGTINFGSDVVGADVKLGLPKGQWLPYAKLGFGSNKWTGGALTGNASGAHLGLGVEYKFAPHFSVAGEFTSMAGKSTGLKSTNNNVTLGLNYYFDTPRVAPIVAAIAAVKPAAPAVKKAPKVVSTPAVAVPVPVIAPEVKPQPKEIVWKTLLEEKPVTYSGVNFEAKSAKLNAAAAKTLDDVSEFAKRYPDAQLTITGHTDFRAKTSKKPYNMKLSVRRAAAFRDALVKRGVPAKRIAIEGFGFYQPIADNNTEEGRAQNRRVVVRSVIKEEKKVQVTE